MRGARRHTGRRDRLRGLVTVCKESYGWTQEEHGSLVLNGEDANTSDNHGKRCLHTMKARRRGNALRLGGLFCAAALLAGNAASGIKNMAVVAAAGSKLQDVPLAVWRSSAKARRKPGQTDEALRW